jgi:DNA repair protein RadC
MANNNTIAIKYWREKLMQKGASSLTNAELLAVLINKGTREQSAIDLGRILLQQANNDLNALGKVNIKSIMQLKGIGLAKAVSLLAALELGRRRQQYIGLAKKKICSSNDAFEIINPIIGDKENETLVVLYLNNANKVTQSEILSYGGLNTTIVDIRLILKNALLHLAPKIIIAHNHPSGLLTPSNPDKEITEKLNQAAKFLDIHFLDHLIIGHNAYYSFADEGILSFQ